jgi:hypothetical protein
MRTETEDKRTKSYLLMRSMLDYGMGALYLGVGLFMIFPEKLGFEMEGFDKVFRFIFGGICILYGAWRVYRGIRKDY